MNLHKTKCRRCGAALVWAQLNNKLVTLDAKAHKLFSLSWGPGDDPRAEPVAAYKRHRCPVPR
jgi:hypothetical protein